jgi:2-methylcitrate dehydratase PrpD
MPNIDTGNTAILAEYFSILKYAVLPDHVIQQAKLIILDALGCQVACSSLENGRAIIKFGETLGGKFEASVFGSNYKTSVINAAMVNGTLGHGDEIDESLEEAGHIAAVVIPSAFACGEKVGASGKDLITAVIAGYDMAGRLADSGISITNIMSYNDGFASVFWSVASACNILHLDPAKTRIAFGIAACQSGGFYDLRAEAKHMAKSLMFGLGARNGVTAALLAQMGYDSPASVFDDNVNFLKDRAGKYFVSGELIKGLGNKFSIMDTCIKLYAAGHPIHAPVHGLLKILKRENILAQEIQSIIVRQPEREHLVVDNRDMLDINIQYCLAVAAFDGRLTWDQFESDRFNDPRVADLKKRVMTIHDPLMDERKKITRSHSAEVDVITKDGREFSTREDYPPGDPKNPASQEEVEKKIMYYASKVLGKENTRKLIEAVKNLESIRDINELGDKLRI